MHASRIHRYARCSPSCFVLALIYIDRLIQRDDFVLSTLNVHRVVITSVMVAAKFFDDFYFNNAFYARVGGISTKEVPAPPPPPSAAAAAASKWLRAV